MSDRDTVRPTTTEPEAGTGTGTGTGTELAAAAAAAADDARWAAVVARDAAADGTFLYGVVTTGVYCRPSCASRQAKRRNVRFFDSADEAEAAGLRPCQRCEPRGDGVRGRQAAIVAEACRILDEREPAPTLDELAREVHLSPHHLHRVFTSITPKAYATARRQRRVRGELTTRATVTDAIYTAGYASNGRFYDDAPARLGMTPSQFRKGAPGVTVRFAVGQTTLGIVLVAATDRGVCAIELGDDPEALVRGLQDRYHAAEVVGDDPDFARLVAVVVGLVEAPGRHVELPLDIRGTAFQERVWRALRDIPAGSTATYAELADRLGVPGGHRAVAAACAANHLAIAVPCHRVIRTDGGLAGYRWGIERKAALLEREAAGDHADA